MDEADGKGVRRKRRAAGRKPETQRAPKVPTDPVLNRALTDPDMRAALKRLQPAERMVVVLAARGLSPTAIGELLGKSRKTVSQQLYMARRRIRQWLGEGKGGAAVVLALLPHRLRDLVSRGQRLAAAATGPSSFVLTALVPLVACTSLATAIAVPTAMPAVTSVASAQRPTAGMGTSWPETSGKPESLKVASPPQTGGPVAEPRAGRSGIADLLHLPADSPDSSYVMAATASPRYDQDHTVVALGLGRTCACPMLFRTSDGGASWQSTAVAVAGRQILLAPSFPTDPRIFVGQDPSSAAVDWVSAGWGQPFAPLPFPPEAAGRLAMAGGRLFSAGMGAVWSMEGAAVAPVMVYPSTNAATVAATGGTVYLLAPPHAVGAGATGTAGPLLFACAPDCQLVGPVPLTVAGPLAVAGQTVVAAAGPDLLASSDGGRHFRALAAPRSGARTIDTLATTPTAAWLVRDGQLQVEGITSTGSATIPLAIAVRAVVPLTGSRVLGELADGGLLCSADGGTTWERRCPPQ